MKGFDAGYPVAPQRKLTDAELASLKSEMTAAGLEFLRIVTKLNEKAVQSELLFYICKSLLSLTKIVCMIKYGNVTSYGGRL